MSRFRIIGAAVAIAASALVFSGSAAAAFQARSFVSPGSGSDANDCSRLAPCLTLQRALNQTFNHGTVSVLDSGTLGATAVINKAVTINVPRGIDAGLSRGSGALLLVKAGSTQLVTINGLSLDGRGSAETGILYSSGLALHLNHVAITDFSATNSRGILAETTADNTHLKLYLDDSFVSGTLLAVKPNAPGTNSSSFVSLENSRLRGNTYGITIDSHGRAQIADSVISGDGIGWGLGATLATTATIVRSTISDNNIGLTVRGGSIIWASRCLITGNNIGVQSTDGAIYSGGDNLNANNGTNGSFTPGNPMS